MFIAAVILKEHPSIWYEEPVAPEMPSDNTALQFRSTALLTSLYLPDERKTYLETYPEISNDIEQHKRNPCQPALDVDYNEIPGERNSAKQNLDME